MIGDKYLANIVAEYLKVCVALFLVLSGYGLNASMNKNKYSITKFYKKHIWKIYKNYWLIWILFVPIGVIRGRTFSFVYGDHYLAKLLTDILGLQKLLGYNSYNATWWFITLILGLYLIFPIIYKLAKKVPLLLLIAPTYTASTSIYLTPQISESGSLDYNSQMANSKLVTNAVNLLTQNNIMSEVAKDVGLESADSVKKLVSVTNESNTEIITISATTKDPKLSKDIANDTVSTFIRTMQKNLNVRNIEVVDKAKLSYIPSGPNVKKNTLLATMVGFVLGCGYATLRFLFDNRLRTKEEAEKYLGIPVFCEIPEL